MSIYLNCLEKQTIILILIYISYFYPSAKRGVLSSLCTTNLVCPIDLLLCPVKFYLFGQIFRFNLYRISILWSVSCILSGLFRLLSTLKDIVSFHSSFCLSFFKQVSGSKHSCCYEMLIYLS